MDDSTREKLGSILDVHVEEMNLFLQHKQRITWQWSPPSSMAFTHAFLSHIHLRRKSIASLSSSFRGCKRKIDFTFEGNWKHISLSPYLSHFAKKWGEWKCGKWGSARPQTWWKCQVLSIDRQMADFSGKTWTITTRQSTRIEAVEADAILTDDFLPVGNQLPDWRDGQVNRLVWKLVQNERVYITVKCLYVFNGMCLTYYAHFASPRCFF